eukprot:7262841-Prorocentrum_lima.AAC.1
MAKHKMAEEEEQAVMLGAENTNTPPPCAPPCEQPVGTESRAVSHSPSQHMGMRQLKPDDFVNNPYATTDGNKKLLM